MNVNGFDDWIPIFRGGKQIDSNGKEHDGDALIDKAIAKFNVATHEPPACIGHPEDNKPAYGWAKELKKGADKLGNLLLAKFGQVEPTFGAMVKHGLFKKRSAAFYPDGTLRHVAFLGAMPPAVKGLPDVSFAEGEAASFEFSEPWTWNSLADVFRRLREYFIEKEGQDTADRLIPDWKIDDLRSAGQPPAGEIEPSIANQYSEKEDKDMTFKQKVAAALNEFLAKMSDDGPAATIGQTPGSAPTGGQFSEADIAKAKNDAAAAEREKVTAEFNEKAKTARQAGLKSEIAVFCDQMAAQGKISPATVKFGLPEMLLAFAEHEDVIEFGETKEKATLYDRFKKMIESAQPLIKFGEVATRDKNTGGQSGTAGEKLGQLTQVKMKDNKLLTYSAAFAEVQRENPELAQEYAAEFTEVK